MNPDQLLLTYYNNSVNNVFTLLEDYDRDKDTEYLIDLALIFPLGYTHRRQYVLAEYQISTKGLKRIEELQSDRY